MNRPRNAVKRNYQRDGNMSFDGNGGASANYEPNSANGPVEDRSRMEPAYALQGATGRYTQTSFRNDNFQQPGDLYRVMKADEQDRLVDTLVDHMGAVRRDIVERAVANFAQCDPALGTRLARGLGIAEPALVR